MGPVGVTPTRMAPSNKVKTDLYLLLQWQGGCDEELNSGFSPSGWRCEGDLSGRESFLR